MVASIQTKTDGSRTARCICIDLEWMEHCVVLLDRRPTWIGVVWVWLRVSIRSYGYGLGSWNSTPTQPQRQIPGHWIFDCILQAPDGLSWN